MKWGLVPSWYKGEPGKFSTLLNNCRHEGMLEKPSFRTAVQKKQRCVVLADGFYEWNKKSPHKQPYLIHLADTSPSPEMKELTSQTNDEETQEVIDGFSDVVGGRMLAMAGLFDVWTREETEEPLFTYTIITLDAHPDFAHIHHRMPAMLTDEAAIEKWLDPSLSTEELAPMLQPTSVLAWYPVSTVVNNVRHKTSECVQRIDPRKRVSKQQNTLLNWFSPMPKTKAVSPAVSDAKDGDPPESKKTKLDN
ncbi:abasic site processing protein HMCES-like isoform X2 [Halichondria panicea]